MIKTQLPILMATAISPVRREMKLRAIKKRWDMLLSERVIVGLILVVVGLGFVIVGYNNIQPTTAEKAVAVIEELSQQKAPDVLRPKKTEGYIFMFGGGVAFVIGLRMILTSRKT